MQEDNATYACFRNARPSGGSVFRHELKCGVSEADCLMLSHRLKYIMDYDKHGDNEGHYVVRSLYFDDLYSTALSEKMAGVGDRSKYRLRFYDGMTDYIRLEKKRRSNGMSLKKGVRITTEQCARLIGRDYRWLLDCGEPLCVELYRKLQSGFRPKTIVEYQRQAFVHSAGNVRITLDKHICSSGDTSRFLLQDYVPCRVPGNCWAVMEIKYDAFLPTHIRNVVQDGRLRLQALSKYVCGRAFDAY